ncbi:hybrid sensor histidine kinase/response regulator [Microvirga lotononidis]|uniref:Chemotaxis protein CheA n=1 Tax=Microvirga lotononidis TaxID=864069 RepID=I4YLV6_9HYPH|nr:hybrid sensor histidine kinase/response regulator [Microvirga lotononidis]EIM24948.1 chemotaxis protein histidine kinase-like protein [Microvirga lotononidis]WQO29555.1 hybrid sensor histidine kinase/response regulator [Microvirga lotononidis]
MDDLLLEFLTETNEHLETVDVEMVRFEQDPNNEAILSNIFRLVHTIKGTCGFLGLPRLEALAHAAETLMGKFRDGMPVTTPAVSLILVTLDRIKEILGELERQGAEPEGSDNDLIEQLERMASQEAPAPEAASAPSSQQASGQLVYQVLERELRPGEVSLDELERAFQEAPGPAKASTSGTLTYQVLERPLKPGEVSLDELERAFREAPGPAPLVIEKPSAPSVKEEVPLPSSPQAAKKNTEASDSSEGGEGIAGKVQTIRVNVDTLEHLMTMVSELVLTRNQLLEIARRSSEDHGYKVPLQRLSQVTAELQDGVMKTRMQPIGNAWQKLPRVVRDLSNELSKKIELVMQGADTELDRQVLEVIKDPLTHMVRNSADHGIESPADRKAAGKPEKGTIRLNAYHEGGSITIEIADDGKGLNFAAIRKKAVERGIAGDAEVERMSDAQVAKFIFHPGFSTAAKVTSVSGRGVGMDVVKTNIELIGGTVDIRSEQGRGTTFTIKIPLTLAIVAALIVASKDQRFAIPQVAVSELVRVSPASEHSIERINGTPILRLRDRLLPIVPLSKVMGLSTDEDANHGFVVVTQVAHQRFGILVDGVFHTEEIVVKPMSSKLRHIQLFSGNTILGDGAVVLIIDPNGLARMVGSGADTNEFQTDAGLEQTVAAAEELTSLLVFRGGGESLKAVPLSLVTRLEEIDASTIEWSSGRPVVQYRGRLMPLVSCDEELAIKRQGMQSLLVFSDGEVSMGLAVAEIVDIVEDKLDVELLAERSDLVGSAVVRGRTTEIVNIAHYLPMVLETWSRKDRRNGPDRSLLLVDSSTFFRDMLVPVLKASGYRVQTASTAQEAVRLLSNGLQVDVVVTDLELTGHSGFALVASLRADPHHSATPVIGMTVKPDPQQIALARKLRISEIVSKIDRRGLLAALAELNASLEEAA